MAKKSYAVLTMVIVTLLLSSACTTTQPDTAAAADGALELYIFGSRTCGECLEIKRDMLYPLEKSFDGKLSVKSYDLEDMEAIALLDRLERQYRVEEKAAQLLFFPDTVLLGYDVIMKNAREMIIQRVNDPSGKKAIVVEEEERDHAEVMEERFNAITFVAVISAAAVDSVNPCAIATMIFLVSFLATQKRKRIEVLITGLSFTFAVFLTYLSLSLGAFTLITRLDQYLWISRAIKWTAVAFSGIIGIICFIDAFRYKKTGDAKDIKLQLPKSVKMRIHKIISTKMTGSRLYTGAFIAGFLVTLLEAICTGQVLLPTLVAISSNAGGELRIWGWIYLVIYCFIFVLPLIAVMVAAYYGMKWNTLSKMMQKNLTLLKILLGMVLIGLSLYLLFGSGILPS